MADHSLPHSESVLTAARLRSLLRYDPDTGGWVWIAKQGSRGKMAIGSTAGCVRPDGRRVIRVDGVLYLASRLAQLWMTGQWPSAEVDHRNVDPSRDRWENLRPATPTQNRGNTRKQRNGRSSAFKGVCFSQGKWKAEIQHAQRRHHLGYFDTEEEAHDAYCRAGRELFGEFFRAR